MHSFSKASADRADRLEDHWRDFAFLGLNYELRIAGGYKIEVRLLTLRMFIQLCSVRSPFLVGGRVGPEHIAQILWRLSPEYERRLIDPNARADFIDSIAHLPYKFSRRAVDRYIDRMLIDKPPQRGKSNSKDKPDTSFAASLVHAISSAYGWSDDVILDLPMPRLFQYLRKIQRSNDPELSYFNPFRDRFLARWMAKRQIARNLAQQQNGDGIQG